MKMKDSQISYKIIFALLFLTKFKTCAEIDKRYGSLPDLFHTDNYDNCMLRGDEALYCYINFNLEPVNQENPSEMWNYIKNISSIKTNFRYDHLRHYICVPQTCPKLTIFNEKDPIFREQLEECYNNKFKHLELKGSIMKIMCETHNPRYPVDWFDIICGVIFIVYVLFVCCATCYDEVARSNIKESPKISGMTARKILLAFSLTRNWKRLTKIDKNPEVEKIRGILGIRFFVTITVVFIHSLMGFGVIPVANTRFVETLHERYLTLLFTVTTQLGLSIFFFISDFFLSNELFKFMKGKKRLGLHMIIWIFAARIFRLLPILVFTILLHATWLRHMGNGPFWNMLIENEFTNCRKNGWTNLLFINNLVDTEHMCLITSWYLALSTQYFMLSLLFIWLLKKHEKYIFYIVGAAAILQILSLFLQNYYYDLPIFMITTVETLFEFKNLAKDDAYQKRHISFIGNMAGPIFGIAFGYYFSKYQSKNLNNSFFNTKFRVSIFWLAFVAFWISLAAPGAIWMYYLNEHKPLLASTYIAVSKPIFCCCLGILTFGFAEGLGGLLIRILHFAPIYVLGRLSYSVYLIHMSKVLLITPALSRYPIYASEFTMVTAYFSDLVTVYICATLLTLLFELPVSGLIKFAFVLKKEEEEEEIVSNLKNE